MTLVSLRSPSHTPHLTPMSGVARCMMYFHMSEYISMKPKLVIYLIYFSTYTVYRYTRLGNFLTIKKWRNYCGLETVLIHVEAIPRLRVWWRVESNGWYQSSFTIYLYLSLWSFSLSPPFIIEIFVNIYIFCMQLFPLTQHITLTPSPLHVSSIPLPYLPPPPFLPPPLLSLLAPWNGNRDVVKIQRD